MKILVTVSLSRRVYFQYEYWVSNTQNNYKMQQYSKYSQTQDTKPFSLPESHNSFEIKTWINNTYTQGMYEYNEYAQELRSTVNNQIIYSFSKIPVYTGHVMKKFSAFISLIFKKWTLLVDLLPIYFVTTWLMLALKYIMKNSSKSKSSLINRDVFLLENSKKAFSKTVTNWENKSLKFRHFARCWSCLVSS